MDPLRLELVMEKRELMVMRQHKRKQKQPQKKIKALSSHLQLKRRRALAVYPQNALSSNGYLY